MSNNFKIETLEDVSGLGLVKGFKVAGVACNIRGNADLERLDVALICSDTPATAAGVFTTNDVKAAPVYVDMEHLSRCGKVKAIVANSGNANACTGERGLKDARDTCAYLAGKFGVDENQILVCSTGRIGEFMPMEKLERGIDTAFSNLSDSDSASAAAAHAIMTSDTRPKTVISKVECGGKKFCVAGMAKGAGMIEPNMATMLAFIASDVSIEQPRLKEILRRAVSKTFNRISVDGDMSTNDTVLCLCGGAGGVEIDGGDLEEAFEEALKSVCMSLARKIVGDGEKITRVVELKVKGARSAEQAEKICRSIGNSLLVKASWYGGDPNWGRLTDSAGYARTGIDFSKIDLDYNGTPVIIKGCPQSHNKELWRKIVNNKTFTINMNLNMGEFEDFLLTTDLTEAYVDFNKGE